MRGGIQGYVVVVVVKLKSGTAKRDRKTEKWDRKNEMGVEMGPANVDRKTEKWDRKTGPQNGPQNWNLGFYQSNEFCGPLFQFCGTLVVHLRGGRLRGHETGPQNGVTLGTAKRDRKICICIYYSY